MPSLGSRRKKPHGGKNAWTPQRPADCGHADVSIPGHVEGHAFGAGPDRVTRIEAIR